MRKWSYLIENFQPLRPEELWVSDITYLQTVNGFIYLSLITDAYSHKISGFHLSHTLEAKGCLAALKMALNNRKYSHDLIHHSDRGIQYCSQQYVQTLLSRGIKISMTTGEVYQNSIAERINGILKSELGLDKVFEDYSEALPVLVKSIYAYNRLRPHLSCDFMTPEQAHTRSGPIMKRWKNYWQSK